jgi:hypothetical protein
MLDEIILDVHTTTIFNLFLLQLLSRFAVNRDQHYSASIQQFYHPRKHFFMSQTSRENLWSFSIFQKLSEKNVASMMTWKNVLLGFEKKMRKKLLSLQVIKKKANQSRRCKLSVMSERNSMQISVQCMAVDNLWSQTPLYNKS